MKPFLIVLVLLAASATLASEPALPTNLIDAINQSTRDTQAVASAEAAIVAGQAALDKAKADKVAAQATMEKDRKALWDLWSDIFGPAPVVPPVTPPVEPPEPPVSTKFAVIVISTTGCLPCKQQEPIVESMQKQNFPITIYVTEDDSKYNTSLYPTLILYQNGKEVDRKVGVQTEDEIRAWADAAKSKAKKPVCTDKSCPCNQPTQPTWNPRKIGR